jgi:putative hemolysin
MTPRNEIIWVRSNTKFSEFLEMYKQHPQTRFPVYDNDFDDVVGILSVKDILTTLPKIKQQTDPTATRLMRRALFIPETKNLIDLFEEMQESGQKLALAIDEFGGISGLITYTRLIEQIVGRTGEEGRKPDKMYITINDNTYIADGGMAIVEANDEMGLDIPEGEYETIAGFFLEQVQSVPKVGTRIRVNNLRLEILEMQGPKITSVRIGKVTKILDIYEHLEK